jgi:hypothetical protein
MTVRINGDGVIELAGRCPAEDAEPLQQYLLAAPGSSVEWRSCAYLHSAVVQVLLAGAPSMQGTPQDSFLANHIAPILDRTAQSSTARDEARSEEPRE